MFDAIKDESVEKFRIDGASGRVTLIRSLNYFTQRYYQLTVLAEVGHRIVTHVARLL